MAGDWIKMRTDLVTSPKVVRMASALKADRFRIVGGLLSVWSLFDAHSDDGVLRGYTLEAIDELAAWPGFAEAMAAVGWIDCDGESLTLPRFDTHNGQTAKRRAMDADRKRVRRMSASEADASPENVSPREEKRREEKKEQEKKPARKRAASKHPIPENFALSDRVREWAREKQFDRLDQHLEHFRLTATAKGYTYADWDAALMNAITGNWAKLPAATAVSQPGGGRRPL